MARNVYRGDKRQKELKRLQKQEEKRQRRLLRKSGTPGVDDAEIPQEGEPPPAASVEPAEAGEEPGGPG